MAANAMVSPMSFLQQGWAGRGTPQYLPMEPNLNPAGNAPQGVLSQPGFNPSNFGSMGGMMGDATGGMSGPPLGGGGPAPPSPTNDVSAVGGMQGDRPGVPMPGSPTTSGPDVRSPFGAPGLEQGGDNPFAGNLEKGGFNPSPPGMQARPNPGNTPGPQQGPNGLGSQGGYGNNPLLHPGAMNMGLQGMMQNPQFQRMMMQRMLGGLNPAQGGMGQNVAPPPQAPQQYRVGMNLPTAADRQAQAQPAAPSGFNRNPFGTTPGVM